VAYLSGIARACRKVQLPGLILDRALGFKTDFIAGVLWRKCSAHVSSGGGSFSRQGLKSPAFSLSFFLISFSVFVKGSLQRDTFDQFFFGPALTRNMISLQIVKILE
jgi:hypothetical protein